jgi:hypothetical protein
MALQAPLMMSNRAAPSQGFPSPFPRVGAIYQRFTSLDEGIVQNIIQLGDGLFLERGTGAMVTVNAAFKPCGLRTIDLTFESAQIGCLRVTDTVEALIAPALLPRMTLQHQLLLGLQEVRPMSTRALWSTPDDALLPPFCFRIDMTSLNRPAQAARVL